MLAAYVEALGPAASIRYGVLPDPAPAPHQAVVRVMAVAVDMVDTFVRSGSWPTLAAFPLVVGRDLVGTVATVGAAVTDVRPGQRVWTNSAGYGGRPGATAELVAVDRDRLYPLPDGADPVSFVITLHPGATAFGIMQRAHLAAGETLAIIGANGAVGCCLVQVAARSGAEVVAVVRHEEATARLRELGAQQVVVAEATDAASAAANAAPRGVDVLVDTTRHLDIGAVPELLNPRGRIVLVAGRGTAEVDLWQFYVRETSLLGFVMSAMTVPELAAAAAWINDSHESQPLSVATGHVWTFADAARAHAMLEDGAQPRMPDGMVGRVALQP